MKLWHVECIVTDGKLYDLMLYLEKIKAYNVKNNVFANGKSEEQESNGRAKKGSQIEWLVAHIKEETEAKSLKTGFEKAGFRGAGLYAALTRAVEQKKLKKTASGLYKPVGA